MLRKLIFLIITAIFFAGCGASPAPAPKAAGAYDVNEASAESGCDQAAEETAPMESPADAEKSTAETTAPGAEYFIFTRQNNTRTDKDGLTLLYEQYCQTSFSSPNPERSRWVDSILEGIARDFAANSENLYDYALDFIEANGTEYFYSHSNYQELGIARYDTAVVSLISLSSLYSGGTHPNSVQTAYNLDVENQRTLRLEDVIYEEAAPVLAGMVREGVEEKFAPLGEGGLFEDYADTIDTSMLYGNMTPYWYFNGTGLVVFYNQYELGPYAAGIIKVELPYEELGGILLSEYLPDEPDQLPGDLILRGEWEGYRRIPITIESEGETILVGVEGRIYQVRLSEVMWLDQTPIAQELLFSAMSMGQNDVLEITGGYTDDTRSFAIEFTNGQGEQKIYYLHAEGMSEEP